MTVPAWTCTTGESAPTAPGVRVPSVAVPSTVQRLSLSTQAPVLAKLISGCTLAPSTTLPVIDACTAVCAETLIAENRPALVCAVPALTDGIAVHRYIRAGAVRRGGNDTVGHVREIARLAHIRDVVARHRSARDLAQLNAGGCRCRAGRSNGASITLSWMTAFAALAMSIPATTPASGETGELTTNTSLPRTIALVSWPAAPVTMPAPCVNAMALSITAIASTGALIEMPGPPTPKTRLRRTRASPIARAPATG